MAESELVAAELLADRAAVHNLLRCWLREFPTDQPHEQPPGGELVLVLPSSGVTVTVPLEYFSAVGWHRFGRPRLGTGASLDATTLAALLAFEAAARRVGSSETLVDTTSFLARVVDSRQRTARHLAVRATMAEEAEPNPFLRAEQAAVLGHPLHPTPKSREGLSETEAAAYSPELRGSFPLHYFAADPSVVEQDSALGRTAHELFAELAGPDLRLPPGTVAVPAHPWQAREIVSRPGIRALLEAGLLHDLGPVGPAWSPTSSVRTLFRHDSPVMLKLSLGIRITNSKRENLRPELARGLQVHRLLAAGLDEAIAKAHPGFDIVRDPAWQAVNIPGQTGESGLEVVVRDNPFRDGDRVGVVAGIVAERPERPDGRSHLATLVHGLAERTGRPVAEIAGEWFDRYLESLVVPVLWLYASYGLGLEAHQQNTLLVLDEQGWPTGGRYRDNQGYYYSQTRSHRLYEWLPDVGKDLGTYCPDELIDERLGYYVGINNVLGLVGAMGSQGLADERDLLSTARRTLGRLYAEHGEDLLLAALLLDSPSLPCKGNLLTQAHGMDELVGPLSAQSVYVQAPNPLAVLPGGLG
ncbi:siderophore synthetase component [Crossiella equi]|uniref:Siderophore synthetase component n=1 Tax=Crossiella equi TaxID=130796 RepID=A0ABS5AMQ5_9PSEU|nr:IucA/IucC family protein [Crossiella equi]MBP2477836.1 siderophore synthetase component [Crossiella equi]